MTSGQRTFGRGIIGLGVGFLIVMAVFAIITIFSVRQTQVDRLPQNEANDETLALIKDCTQPSGACFKRSQRATAKAVNDISAVVVLVIACGDDLPTDLDTDMRVKELTACVTQRLGQRGPR